jgi:hypothetical protein
MDAGFRALLFFKIVTSEKDGRGFPRPSFLEIVTSEKDGFLSEPNQARFRISGIHAVYRQDSFRKSIRNTNVDLYPVIAIIIHITVLYGNACRFCRILPAKSLTVRIKAGIFHFYIAKAISCHEDVNQNTYSSGILFKSVPAGRIWAVSTVNHCRG